MIETPLRKNLARRGLFGFLLQVVLRLRGLLLIPILTRMLAPAELGVISLANALTSGLAPLLLLGMHTGLALHLVRLHGRAVRPAVLTVLSFATIFSTALTGALLAVLSTGVFGAATAPLMPVLGPIGLFAIGLTLREVATALPQVRQKLAFIAWNSLLMDFGGAIAGIVLVLSGHGAYGVLLGVAVMSILGSAVAAVQSLRMAEGPWTYDRAFLLTTLRTALPVVPLAIGLWTLQSSDYFFVAYYQGAADVAVYGLAYNLASPILMVVAAVNLTYLPTCVEILGQGRGPFARFMDDSTRLLAIFGIAAIAFTSVAGAKLAAWIAGPLYEESGHLLPILVAAYVFFSLSQLQQFIPGTMAQDMKASARAHGFAALLNVIMNGLLIPRFGLWGAAWSTLSAYSFAFFLLAHSVRLLLPELLWMKQLGRLFILVLCAVGLGQVLQSAATGVLSAVALGTGAVLATLVIAVALGLATREDWSRFLGMVKPRRLTNA